ncbi:MAG: 5'/3'-nucleotidase SurE [Acetobacteraceae bacterium]|nr:5'/3'-nucleotidase SurE [Acetobacteraceae bacterium]
MSETQRIARRVLLTNDDGIAAPGLRVLQEIAAEIADDVWVVAPERDQSGTSHSISLHAPVRMSRRGERIFGVEGTPGDCVVMGVRHLMRDALPDLVLSGINQGANLGTETVFSGTVGAAMAGMLLGIPSIGLSAAFVRGEPVHWDTALAHGPAVLRRLSGMPWSPHACLNVNFPNVPPDQAGPLTLTRQGRGPLDGIEVDRRIDPRQQNYFWIRLTRTPGADLPDSEGAAVAAHRISVTPLRFERTDEETLRELWTRF